MKILLDDIVFSLQSTGGISVYFNELKKHYKNKSIKYKLSSKLLNSKIFRYLPLFYLSAEKVIFHSSYYRVVIGWKIKSIVTVHDFTYEKYRSGFSKYLHVFQKYISMYFADGIICVSHNTARDLRQLYPKIAKTKRIEVVYNGVSDDYYFTGNYDVGNFVLSVGSRAGYKNFEATLKAIAGTQFGVKIVGGGVLTPDEQVLIKELGIEGRVDYLGKCSNSELNELYNTASCLVYPSLYEGFGIPVIEAMRAGCSVVAHNDGAVREIASDYAILVDCRVSVNITNALEELARVGGFKECIDRNIKYASSFSWEKCSIETRDFYQAIYES